MTPQEIESIVRKLEDDYAAAFRRNDVGAMAALVTDDVTVLTEFGDVVEGRAEVERSLERAFAGMGEITLDVTPVTSKAITDDVIVSHGTALVSGALGPDVEKLVYTRVFVRRGGEWRLAATQVAQPTSLSDPRSRGGEAPD